MNFNGNKKDPKNCQKQNLKKKSRMNKQIKFQKFLLSLESLKKSKQINKKNIICK